MIKVDFRIVFYMVLIYYKYKKYKKSPSQPIKFYMSISNRPITIIRGDNLKSISFLYRKTTLFIPYVAIITKKKF